MTSRYVRMSRPTGWRKAPEAHFWYTWSRIPVLLTIQTSFFPELCLNGVRTRLRSEATKTVSSFLKYVKKGPPISSSSSSHNSSDAQRHQKVLTIAFVWSVLGIHYTPSGSLLFWLFGYTFESEDVTFVQGSALLSWQPPPLQIALTVCTRSFFRSWGHHQAAALLGRGSCIDVIPKHRTEVSCRGTKP